MGFTLPRTRLAFKHLRTLLCQRLGSSATLTTWVSTLYMRLTSSLEFQDVILTWILNYILRHHHETLLRGLWNYVYYLRHHHELSPRGSWNYVHYMKHHHEILPRDLWNYVLYLRHHHELSPRRSWNYVHYMRHHHEISPRNSWNYILIHTIVMSHQPNIELSRIPNLKPIFNQPSNCVQYAKSYQTHQFQSQYII